MRGQFLVFVPTRCPPDFIAIKFFFQDKLDVLQSFRMESEFEKMRSLNASVSYELNNANRFFYQQTTPVRECMKSLFKDELYGLDFKNDAANSKKFIDDWVSNQTRYQINDLLANSDIPEDTKLILVNTAKKSLCISILCMKNGLVTIELVKW